FEIPAPLKQIGIHSRLLCWREVEHGTQHPASLFEQTLFAALVIAELLRILFRLACQRQAFRLLTQRTDGARIELGDIAHTLTHWHTDLLGYRQDDFGIAQIEQAALAGLLQHILR